MKNIMKHIKYLLPLLAVIVFACEPEMEEFKPEAGQADFSRYVAVGNSITAGYADGALYRQGQLFSYPNLIAGQLKQVGAGTFKQPLMYDDLGMRNYMILNVAVPVDEKLVLAYKSDCQGNSTLIPVPATGSPNPENQSSIAEEGPFQNMGVPGIRLTDLRRQGIGSIIHSLGNFNPYFSRFAQHDTSSVLGDVLAQNPSFFTLWIGNNDVLKYATAPLGGASITATNAFDFEIKAVVEKLTQNGAKGVIANIPDITSLPFFTTIHPRSLYLETPQEVNELNELYAWNPDINFSLGDNKLVVFDPTVIGGMRQIKTNELVLLSLPLDSIKCGGWGGKKPISQNYYLSEEKITNIKNAVLSYNASIKAASEQYNIALLDVNKYLSDAKSGIVVDGIHLNTEFITGGIFSLDGIHLSARGNVIVANFFIEAINAKYNAQIPLINISDFPGTVYP